MIQDIPNPEVFKKLAIENLDFAIDLINNSLVYGEDWESENINHAVNKKTAIILLFQGIENFLKFKISEISPLLLISNNIKDIKNKKFNEIYLHGFNELISIYENIIEKEINNEKIIEIKNLRNKIVHGFYNEEIKCEKIIKWIYIFSSSIGDPNIWTPLSSKIPTDYDPDEYAGEIAHKNEFIEACKKLLTNKEFQLLFNINTSIVDKLFHCSNCFIAGIEHFMEDVKSISKSAYLKSENELFCICCNNKYKFSKENCINCDQVRYLIYDKHCEDCLKDY